MGQFEYERRFTRRRGDAEKELAENLSISLLRDLCSASPRLRVKRLSNRTINRPPSTVSELQSTRVHHRIPCPRDRSGQLPWRFVCDRFVTGHRADGRARTHTKRQGSCP